MQPSDLSGIYPPIPTAFDADQSLALDALRQNLERWNQEPLAGYVVGGSNGEFVLLSDEERVTVVAAAREVVPEGRLLIAGAGAQSTARTIALAERMAAAGADALLVVTPNYYRGLMTAGVLVEHYRAVAEVSPVPLLLYNVPANTGLNIPIEAIVELASHPNVIGTKDSSGDIGRLAETVRRCPDDFRVLAGSGGFMLPALSVGAVGAVAALANIAARPMADLIASFEAGEPERARGIQARLLAPNRAVTARFGVPGLKAALEMLGFYGGPVRGPLLPLQDRDRQELRSILTAAELLAH